MEPSLWGCWNSVGIETLTISWNQLDASVITTCCLCHFEAGNWSCELQTRCTCQMLLLMTPYPRAITSPKLKWLLPLDAYTDTGNEMIHHLHELGADKVRKTGMSTLIHWWMVLFPIQNGGSSGRVKFFHLVIVYSQTVVRLNQFQPCFTSPGIETLTIYCWHKILNSCMETIGFKCHNYLMFVSLFACDPVVSCKLEILARWCYWWHRLQGPSPQASKLGVSLP